MLLLSLVLVPVGAFWFHRWASEPPEELLPANEVIVDTAKVSVRRDADWNHTNGRIWLTKTGLVFAPQRFSIGMPTSEGTIYFDEILDCEIEPREARALFQRALRVTTKDQTWRIYLASLTEGWSSQKKEMWKREIENMRS
jgi:hypothetical protein